MDEQTIEAPQLVMAPDQSGAPPGKTILIPKIDPKPVKPPPDYVEMHREGVLAVLREIESAQGMVTSVAHQIARRDPHVMQSVLRDSLGKLAEAVFQAGWLVSIVEKIPVAVPPPPPAVLEPERVEYMMDQRFVDYAKEAYGVDLKEMVAELNRQKPAEMPTPRTVGSFETLKRKVRAGKAGRVLHYLSADNNPGCPAGELRLAGIPWQDNHDETATVSEVTCLDCLSALRGVHVTHYVKVVGSPAGEEVDCGCGWAMRYVGRKFAARTDDPRYVTCEACKKYVAEHVGDVRDLVTQPGPASIAMPPIYLRRDEGGRWRKMPKPKPPKRATASKKRNKR